MNIEEERSRIGILREISPAESFGEALSNELRARQQIEAPEGAVILFDYRGHTYAALWRNGQWRLTDYWGDRRTISMHEMLEALGRATNARVVTETKEV